jgi:ribosomal protein S27E
MSESLGLECPKCHKNELVRLENSNTFKCIVCGYICDLSTPPPEGKGTFYMALIMLLILSLMIVVG